MLSRVVVEREQLVEIIGQLRDGLRKLRAVGGLERVPLEKSSRHVRPCIGIR